MKTILVCVTLCVVYTHAAVYILESPGPRVVRSANPQGGFPFGSQYPQQYQQYPGFQQPFGGGGGANTFGTAGSQSQNLGGLQSQLTNAGSQTNAFQNGVGGFGANGAAQVLGGTNGLSSGASADTQKFNFGPGGFSGGSSNSNSQSSGFNSGFSG